MRFVQIELLPSVMYLQWNIQYGHKIKIHMNNTASMNIVLTVGACCILKTNGEVINTIFISM